MFSSSQFYNVQLITIECTAGGLLQSCVVVIQLQCTGTVLVAAPWKPKIKYTSKRIVVLHNNRTEGFWVAYKQNRDLHNWQNAVELWQLPVWFDCYQLHHAVRRFVVNFKTKVLSTVMTFHRFVNIYMHEEEARDCVCLLCRTIISTIIYHTCDQQEGWISLIMHN